MVILILAALLLIIASHYRLELRRYDRHLGLDIVLRLKSGTGLIAIRLLHLLVIKEPVGLHGLVWLSL